MAMVRPMRSDSIDFDDATGVARFELDDDLKPLSREFLGDPDAVAKAAAAVAAQGRAK